MNPETIAGMIQSNSAVEDSTTVLLDSDGSLLSATGDAAVAELLENADVSSAEDSDNHIGRTALLDTARNGSRKPGGILSRSYRCLPSVQSQIGSSAGHSRSCWLWSA